MTDRGDPRHDNAQPKDHLHENPEKTGIWRAILLGVIGVAASTVAAGKLRHTIDWVYTQFCRSQTYFSRSSCSSRSKDDAWKRYYRRLQDEHDEERERLERIRRMQDVFNRARNKGKSYETWGTHDPSSYNQHFQRDDWYWKAETSNKSESASYRISSDRGHIILSHHYAVLGLDRFRVKPYTDLEIKTAFREKAKEFHPDQNQGNEERAAAKFKEVVVSYEAIKSERKNAHA